MDELQDKENRFNFKRYQYAKKSRRMLVRFIIYSIVIAFILYLIMEKGKPENKVKENDNIEEFQIESD